MISHCIMWLLKKVHQNFCWHEYECIPGKYSIGVSDYYICKKCDRFSHFGL